MNRPRGWQGIFDLNGLASPPIEKYLAIFSLLI